MKANMYKLIERCVEEGVQYGYTRAHKHTDHPTQEQLEDQIIQAVMNEICEWFEFNQGEN